MSVARVGRVSAVSGIAVQEFRLVDRKRYLAGWDGVGDFSERRSLGGCLITAKNQNQEEFDSAFHFRTSWNGMSGTME